MRIPRKKKKKIPNGWYCYEFIEEIWGEDKYLGYKIKKCPFYQNGEGIFGHCKLINSEVTDQVKSCKYNWRK